MISYHSKTTLHSKLEYIYELLVIFKNEKEKKLCDWVLGLLDHKSEPSWYSYFLANQEVDQVYITKLYLSI